MATEVAPWEAWIKRTDNPAQGRSTADLLTELVDELSDYLQNYFSDQVIRAYLKTPNRNREVVYVRQVIMALSRQLTHATLGQIGTTFGRDHATVVHACKCVEDRKYNAMLRRVYDVAWEYCISQGYAES